MKHLFLSFLVLFSMNAYAQKMSYVQKIKTPVTKVKVAYNNEVTIVSDTSNYLIVTSKNANLDENTMSDMIQIAHDQITFGNKSTQYDIELHLASENLSLYAQDNANIILKSNIGDTLNLQSFSATASDVAKITILPFLLVEKSMELDYMDLATIDHNGYCGQVNIVQDNTLESAFTDLYSRNIFRSQSNIATQMIPQPYYSPTERSHFSFLWGWNNWGTNPLNGLMSATGASELKTTFSSYQLALTYAIVARRHFEMGLGLGYESDKYNFEKAFVQIQNGDFVASTEPGNWINAIVTRYITLPVEFTYYSHADHSKSFGVGLSVITGLGISAKTKGYYVPSHEQMASNAEVMEQTKRINNFLNPLKCDARITLHFHAFSFFVQSSFLPVFNYSEQRPDDLHHDLWKRKLMPFKMGFSISI